MKKNIFNFLLIGIWVFIVLYTALKHELWFDEITSIGLVKYCSLPDLFKMLRTTEGHPCLWYLLELPFVKLGFYPEIVQVLSFFFTAVSVCYFCLRSRFNYILKSIFIFSAGMLYLLPVIARSYSLIPILIFVLADLYPKRHEKPLLYAVFLVLLSQVHSLTWGFCIVCSCLFIYEMSMKFIKDRAYNSQNAVIRCIYFIPAIILLLNFIFTFLFFKDLILNYDFFGREKPPAFWEGLALTKENIYDFISFVPVHMELHGILLQIFIAAGLIFLGSLFLINKKSFLIFFSAVFSFEYIMLKVYLLVTSQKLFVIFLFLIFSCWILEKQNTLVWKIKEASLYIILVIMFFNPLSFKAAADDIKNYFSNYPITAEYLKTNLKEDETVLFIGNSWEYYKLILEHQLTYILLKDLPQYPIDNKFLEKYIIDSRLNIKYIIMSAGVENNIKPPYIKVFETPKNTVNSVQIGQNFGNDFIVYKKID